MDLKESADYTFAQFLEQHSTQLNASAVPPELWHCLYLKLVNQCFDAGQHFQIICELSDDGGKSMSVIALEDMHNNEETSVFLIDHLLTFESENAKKILRSSEDLVKRLADLFGIEETSVGDDDEETEKIVTSDEAEKMNYEQECAKAGGDGGCLPRHESVDARLGAYSVTESDDKIIDLIIREIWKSAQTYTVRYSAGSGFESRSLWYIMDEFGARIRHQSDANTRVVPLMFLPQGVAYNVMFLTRPIVKDEELTRDYAQNLLSAQNPDWRKYLELPWNPQDFSQESSDFPLPDDSYFMSGRIPDDLATAEDQETAQSAIAASLDVLKGRKMKIYANDTQLVQYLKNISYEIVNDWKKADVVWDMQHFHDFKDLCEFNPCGMVNQFPYESCLTVKDLLAACAMQDARKHSWYQLTYNLNTQLPQFVACFHQRALNGESNVWIVKPWNLARGMEMCVTDDLNKIIRFVETGPKIVSEYITRPLLFPRPDNGNLVKFDLRYIVFVNSFQPLEAFVYKNFWIRFAINEFNLNDLEDAETHFTVFNYVGDKDKVLQMKCDKFIETIEKSYPQLKWSEMQEKIYNTIKDALKTASSNPPPRGVAQNAQSRAMYGVDIMLKYENEGAIKPVLLEANFMPDCTRACEYYEDFADTAFSTMFLNDPDPARVAHI